MSDAIGLSFGVLDAITITDAKIVSMADADGALPEDWVPEWNAATAYAVNDEVYRASTHRVYARVVAGTTATAPELDPVNWYDWRPTNRYAAFDIYGTTRVMGQDTLTITLRPGPFVTAVWLGALICSTVGLVVTDGPGGPELYRNDGEFLASIGREDWQSFFLAPDIIKTSVYFGGIPVCPDPVITITAIRHASTAQIGIIQVGRFLEIGHTQYGTDFGRVRYSTVEFAADGSVKLTPRPSGGEARVKVQLTPIKIDLVDYLLGYYDARPVLWVGHTDQRWAVLNKFGLMEARVSLDNPALYSLTGTVTGLI
ncbi:MAG: hypothetical protein JSR68_08215 [Proteobacteria bacterium]|nr:hypothetical protein [Pseudomonadota bacterium]